MPGPESGQVEACVRASGLTQRVLLANGISDAEMNWCYRNCELLLAPSILEGFGLPIVEGRSPAAASSAPTSLLFVETGGLRLQVCDARARLRKDFAAAAVASLGERRPLPVHLTRFSSAVVAEQYARLYRILADVSDGVGTSPADLGDGRPTIMPGRLWQLLQASCQP